MKLEEVLPHLRAGGKVKIVEFASTNKSYDLEELNSMLTFSGLSRREFEIVETPIYFEMNIVLIADDYYSPEYVEIPFQYFPDKFKSGQKYNIKFTQIIEEIKE